MLKCLACHVCAHVAPEEVPEAFPFLKACHHPVESDLESSDFGGLIHLDERPAMAVLHLGHGDDDFTNWVRD
ncbi:hypothetical protein MAHJHV55_35700 [Mycobacterium avium subsp. hominissuis]